MTEVKELTKNKKAADKGGFDMLTLESKKEEKRGRPLKYTTDK